MDGGDTSPPSGEPPNHDYLATISGTVWAPGQAPGLVPLSHEIPVFDALVYVSEDRPAPIPQVTFCERCVEPAGRFAVTAHDGTFSLSVLPGTYWLVIQKGQFRREQQVTLGEYERLELTAEESTLPSAHNPAEGKWIPRIAMAVGNHDHLQDILGKMGLGRVNANGAFVPSSAAGVMDVYTNGPSFGAPVAGTLGNLVSDLQRMLEYHIIFIPCSGDAHTSLLRNQNTLRNIRDYVAAGGKLYVTDWSGEWADNVFPAQITLGPGQDTPASAYDPITDTWDPSQFGNADGDFYDSHNGEAVDADLRQWLHGQHGPVVNGYESTVSYDASHFSIEGNWNIITQLDSVVKDTDAEGFPIYDTPKSYIIGGRNSSLPKRPLTVTYEPTGCGRVLYSTYHTTDKRHNGLVPQERVLLYLIMEIGICQSGPIVN